MIAILAVTVTIPLLLLFQRWRRKHHKNLELIVSKTPPTGQTGKLQLPRGHSVASAVPNLFDVATTVILWSELLRENRYREISRQCPNSADLDLIEGTNTGLERPVKDWINRFSVTENGTQTSTPPVLTTARPLETVSKQPASTDRPLGQSPGERAMAPIDA
jgi:hypothetical protein